MWNLSWVWCSLLMTAIWAFEFDGEDVLLSGVIMIPCKRNPTQRVPITTMEVWKRVSAVKTGPFEIIYEDANAYVSKKKDTVSA